MSDFASKRKIVGRKEHRCDHCRRIIPVGEPHWRSAGVFDGEFSTAREHFECRSAWDTLNFDMRDIQPYEGVPFLGDDEFDVAEVDWMREKHPVVAQRLGWV